MKKSEWQTLLRNANTALAPEVSAPAVPAPVWPSVVVDRSRLLDETFEVRVPIKAVSDYLKLEDAVLSGLADFGHAGAELICQMDRDIMARHTSYRFILENRDGPPPAQIALRAGWTDDGTAGVSGLVARLFVPRHRGSALARLIREPLPDRVTVINAFLEDAKAFAGWPSASHVSGVIESAGTIQGQIISGTGDAKENFTIQLASAMKVTCKPHPKTILTISDMVAEGRRGR